ncbi:MAG: biotin--[acetyl-CoA-carboxylase] ligase [Prevotellaceae bacterium]|nr:biotin--[acetyl-CoA-carboxylase] ligase [Prevotellaceae bacterium]MDY2633019.1 biotin--[acetyl-CoA-carboxylase] ligase [Prevotella sp.]
MKFQRISITETDSTNNMLQPIEVPDDTCVVAVADYQTAGRGQAGNRWESEHSKNLLFSMAVRPSTVPVNRQFVLSMAHALALKEALDSRGIEVLLKWPNDIYVENRKLGGTLIELSVAEGSLKKCIFGTGINVNQTVFVSDAPNPVSLKQLLGTDIDRQTLLDDILRAFETCYRRVEQQDYGYIQSRYHASLYRRNGYHPYQDQEGIFEAKIIEVAQNGIITLQDRNGKNRQYAFKEVAFVISEQHDSNI